MNQNTIWFFKISAQEHLPLISSLFTLHLLIKLRIQNQPNIQFCQSEPTKVQRPLCFSSHLTICLTQTLIKSIPPIEFLLSFDITKVKTKSTINFPSSQFDGHFDLYSNCIWKAKSKRPIWMINAGLADVNLVKVCALTKILWIK